MEESLKLACELSFSQSYESVVFQDSLRKMSQILKRELRKDRLLFLNDQIYLFRNCYITEWCPKPTNKNSLV
ncbi:hypothetical protein KIN20_010222 [Parelaphostrongylus tenuis]|uniref:Uncharacterized protein n=1 Tax=Parelaphostrongylus tenuis TaxID=148309 RepID=A0AAD5MTS0_PARTN|nr:hypothetical protein KIN20_010222 [Parelaphostrongylus tenuis]